MKDSILLTNKLVTPLPFSENEANSFEEAAKQFKLSLEGLREDKKNELEIDPESLIQNIEQLKEARAESQRSIVGTQSLERFMRTGDLSDMPQDQSVFINYAVSVYRPLMRFLPGYSERVDPIGMTNVGTETMPRMLPVFGDPPDDDELKEDNGYRKFEAKIKALRKSKYNDVYVYTVEPAEQAQNISSVLAAEKLRSFTFAAAAMIPNTGLDIGGGFDAMRDTQERIEAINRHPLVVGYADVSNPPSKPEASAQVGSAVQLGPTNQVDSSIKSNQSFGWVIGPRFAIRDKKLVYEFTDKPYSLTATLAVPAWWNGINFIANNGWVPDMSPGTLSAPGAVTQKSVTLPCNLRPDMRGLTRLLLADSGFRDSKPTLLAKVSASGADPLWLVTPGVDEQKLIIEGEGLWRSPRVFIGSQEAKDVEVLPDMRGLIATFQDLQAPPDPSTDRADLSVYTSVGVVSARRAERFISRSGASGTTRYSFLELRTSAVGLPGGPSKPEFRILKDRLPEGLHKMKVLFTLLASDGSASSVLDSGDLTLTPNLDLIQSKSPRELLDADQLTDVTRYRVTGHAQLFPNALPFDPVVGEAELYQFPDPAQRKLFHTDGPHQLKVDPKGNVSGDLPVVPIIEHDRLLKMWPALAEAFEENRVIIEIGSALVSLKQKADSTWVVPSEELRRQIDSIVQAVPDKVSTKDFSALKLHCGQVETPIEGKVIFERQPKPKE